MKKSQWILSLLTLSTLGLIFDSCKKDEEDNGGSSAPTMTKTEMLTGNNWVVTSFMSNSGYGYDYCATPDGNGNFEFFPDCFDECDLDDFYDFEADSTYMQLEGADICPYGGQVIDEGEWSFNTNETMLELDSDNGVIEEFEIVSLSTSQLVLRQSFAYNGETVVFTVTYN